MSNEEEQSDEIMALQSIYGEEICICNPEEKPIKGTILVDINIGLENYEFLCNGDLTSLKHLSPVILNFSLPSNYPHESLPDFTLSCIWLTDQQLENLSNILKDRWKESCSVILYAWMDFLKTEIFNILDIKFPLEISQTNMMRLIETNRLREEQIFKTSLHICPVCFIELPGINCIKLNDCEHVFCKECLENYLSICISDGNVNFIFCLDEGCDVHINHHTIKSLVSESLYERYDQLLLRKSLSAMSDVQYCPRANCGQPAIVDDDNDSLAFCHACNFAFCIKCNSTYHGVNLCKADMLQEELRKYRMANLAQSFVEGELKHSNHLIKLKMVEEQINTLLSAQRKIVRKHLTKTQKQKSLILAKSLGQKQESLILAKSLEQKQESLILAKSLEQKQESLEQKQESLEQNQESLILAKSFQQNQVIEAILLVRGLGLAKEDKELLVSKHGKEKIDNAMSTLWVNENSRSCPNCPANIQRISGCDYMICTACREPFNWSRAVRDF